MTNDGRQNPNSGSLDLSGFLKAIVDSTYANSDVVKITLGEEHFQLPAALDGWNYLDEYKGWDPFYGVEKVWNPDGALVMVRSYYGGMVGPFDKAYTKEVFGFLRSAMQFPQGIERGPERFEEGEWVYEHPTFDEVGWAREIITHKGKKVHEVKIHVTLL